jgi:hypothetical protein
VSQRLSDEDVEGIASRVMAKGGLGYAVVTVATLLIAPMFIFPVLSATRFITTGSPAPLAVAVTAAVIAVPMVAFILLWGRRRTR